MCVTYAIQYIRDAFRSLASFQYVASPKTRHSASGKKKKNQIESVWRQRLHAEQIIEGGTKNNKRGSKFFVFC